MKDNILLVGSSCVGKTSVLDLLREDPTFKNYSVIESLARQLRQRYTISGFDDVSFQDQLFDAYYQKHRTLKHDTIFDRSIIDVYTFTQTIKEDSFDFCAMLSDMKDSISDIKESFGKVFYFPIYWKVEDDGERLIDPERRVQWDKNIQILLEDEQIPYYIVPYCDPIERVVFIRSIVNS